MDPDLPAIPEITAAQVEWTTRWHQTVPAPVDNRFLELVRENHFHNFSLWHAEDEARRTDCGPEVIADAKRTIDRHNQLRNNAMERIDSWLTATLSQNPLAPQHSETPGMMLDRLSILALKEYHMREEAERTSASPEHRAICADRLAVIREQRTDLALVLEHFLREVSAGTRRFKVYFQFKMYNDPALNPKLYNAPANPDEL